MYCIALHCVALYCIIIIIIIIYMWWFHTQSRFQTTITNLGCPKVQTLRCWHVPVPNIAVSNQTVAGLKIWMIWNSKETTKNEPWSTTIDFHIGPLQGWVNTILHISGLSFQMFPTWPTPWNCINFSMLLENEISVGELTWLRPQRIFPYHPCQSRRLGSFVTKCGQMPLHGLHGLHGGSTVWRAHSCIFFWVSQALT